MSQISRYTELAKKLVEFNIGVRPGEQVLMVCDTDTDMDLPYALASAIDQVGGEYTISIIQARTGAKSGSATDVVATSAQSADVIISLTRYNSCALFDPRINILMREKKLRDITLSGRDPQTFLQGGALADYEKIRADGLRLEKLWGKTYFHLTTPLGTDLRGGMGDFPIVPGYGIAHNAGEGMAFSDGEVSSTPNNGSVNGVVVIDGPIQSMRQPTEPVRMTIQNSRVISVDGGDSDIVDKLRHMLETVDGFSWLAEIAIGLNPCSLRNGDFPEEKKALGNVHIALGSNEYYGGSNACEFHLDCIMKNGTMIMDDKLVLEHGNVLI